jgi:hypothetical protein
MITNLREANMITLKLGDLNEINRGLTELMGKELPPKAAYWVAKILKKIVAENTDFEEARLKLIKKWGVLGEDGEVIVNPETKRFTLTDEPAFEVEYRDLADGDFEIEMRMMRLSELGGIYMKPAILFALMDKIIEEDPE